MPNDNDRWAKRGAELPPLPPAGAKTNCVGRLYREGETAPEEFFDRSGAQGYKAPTTNDQKLDAEIKEFARPRHVLKPEAIPQGEFNKGIPDHLKHLTPAEKRTWLGSPEGNNWLNTKRLDGPLSPHIGPRNHDAEVHMIKNVLTKTTGATKGELHFKVDRLSCPACKAMFFEFTQARPGIKLIQHSAPDPIWLDTDIVSHALKGDAAVNQQLATYRKSGRQLLVVPAVANELLNGNVLTMKDGKPVWQQAPSPQLKLAMETGMKKLGIEIDWSSSKVPMHKRIEYSQIKSANIVTESDRLVLSQIKASAEKRFIEKPQVITGVAASKPMMTEASKWGIESVPKAAPKPGSAPALPRIDLADYPPDREGAISRFFKDRTFLKKFALIGVHAGAQDIKDLALDLVEKHFKDALSDARKEFQSNYPDPDKPKAEANLDRYKQAYEAALSKLKAPTRAKAAEAVILAFTPARDIDKTKKYLDDQISKVKSAADGTISGYSKVAEEYIDAMIELYKKVSAAQKGLVEIAADIEKRGSIIKAAGDALEETFWRYAPAAAAFPVVGDAWMDVHTVATVFMDLGRSVLAFASDIKTRCNSYARMQKQLDEELMKVSDELAKYAPQG